MKKILCALAMTSALSMPAVAADIQDYDLPETFSWSGAYVGAQQGYGWADPDWSYQGGSDVDLDADGIFGGVFGGYNYQFGSFVVGAEIEANLADTDDAVECPNAIFECRADLEAFGSVRARAGYAFDRYMLYAAGGAALGELEIETVAPLVGTNGEDHSLFGYTVGAGAEAAIGTNLTLRAEYAYYGFESEEFQVDFDGIVEADLDLHTVRVGVAYRF